MLSVVKTAFVLDEHLLQQAAFEGLGVGDLLGHAFDLPVQGREEVREFSLFGEGRTRNSELPNALKIQSFASTPALSLVDQLLTEVRTQKQL